MVVDLLDENGGHLCQAGARLKVKRASKCDCSQRLQSRVTRVTRVIGRKKRKVAASSQTDTCVTRHVAASHAWPQPAPSSIVLLQAVRSRDAADARDAPPETQG